MNRESSRSHSILTLHLRCTKQLDDLADVTEARLNLVDLAGSERQQLTGSTGVRLKEAGNINRSLLALSSVINALSEQAQGRAKHAPYRDSKLTFLLKDSLGGNSKTCIVACITPNAACLGETISTLRFAQRAKQIRNRAIANKEMHGHPAQLQAEIRRLQAKLSQEGGGVDGATVRLLASRQAEQSAQIAALQKQLGLLEEALRRKDQQVSAERMVVKLRDATIKALGAQERPPPAGEPALLLLPLQQEIAELRRLVEHHPEVTRFAQENLQLRERLRRQEGVEERLEQAMELEARLDALCKQLAAVGGGRESALEQSLSEAMNELDACRTQLSYLAEQLAHRQIHEQERETLYAARQAEFEAKISTLQSDYESSEAARRLIFQERDNVLSQLANLQQTYERDQVEQAVARERHEQDRQAMVARLQQAMELAQALEEQTLRLKDLLLEAEAKNRDLQAENGQLEQTRTQLEGQVGRLREELSEAVNRLGQAEQHANLLTSQLTALNTQHALLQRQAEAQQRESETLRSRLEMQLANLRQQLAAQPTPSGISASPNPVAPDEEARLALSMATHELELARAKIREMERALEQAKVNGLREGIQQELSKAQEPVSPLPGAKRTMQSPRPVAATRSGSNLASPSSTTTANQQKKLEFMLQSAREDNEELLAQLSQKANEADQLRIQYAQIMAAIEAKEQENQRLCAENERLLQHHNLKQKLQYHLRIKQENNELKEELQRRQELETAALADARQLLAPDHPVVRMLQERLLSSMSV